MPIYEYCCPECLTEFELRRPVSEMASPAPCPQCGASGKRLVSVFSSKVGFYVRAPSKPAFRKAPAEKAAGPARPKPLAKRRTKKG